MLTVMEKIRKEEYSKLDGSHYRLSLRGKEKCSNGGCVLIEAWPEDIGEAFHPLNLGGGLCCIMHRQPSQMPLS